MTRLLRSLRPWGLLLLMLGAATGARVALDPLFNDRYSLLTYYPVTVFIALFAGPWPAATSVIVSAILSEVLFAPGRADGVDLTALSIYVVVNAVLILLVERVRRARRDAVLREEAARASEVKSSAQRGLLEVALESVEAAVYSWDPATGEAQWDARFRALYGFTPDTPAQHAAMLARVHPEDRVRLKSALGGAADPAGSRRYSIEYRIFRDDDGAARWLTSTGFAVFEGERLARFVGTARDITERHRVEAALRESEQRFATLAEGSPVLLWVSGLHGYEFVNRAYLEFVGVRSDDEVRGYDWTRFVHPADREECINEYQRAFATQTRFTCDFRLRRNDGEYRWMRSDATPRFGEDGELAGYVGASVDTTEQRNAEDALRVADRQKDEFLAMLAHELRNPLAPIRNASEFLALRYAGDQQAALPIAMIRRQSEHLARLLDDLLDVTRIAQGRVTLKLDTLEIGAVVDQAVETVAPLARAKDQQLRAERDPTQFYIRGDRARLVQSLTNVLQNAVKFTPERGEIVVAVRDAGPDLELTVRDNGVGITAELLPRVCELFVQSERTLDRSQGGLGIGLSVVKHLVEMHGGALQIASEGQSRGTTVTILLPRVDAPAEVAVPTLTAAAARRVLVVDDSADAANSLAMLLELDGHEVATAYSASAGLETAERMKPDVAFIDIGLPLMDGYEVARRLRATDGGRAIRLVALTGYGQAEDRDEARRAGFDHHLVKPADWASVGAILAAP